jgi:chemotaxis protein MotA
MDLITVVGILLALGTVIGGYILEGGTGDALFLPTAVLIVFGGTFAVTFASFTWSQLKRTGAGFMTAVTLSREQQPELIEDLANLAALARRQGIVRLEAETAYITNPFMRNGIMIIVDGTDQETTKQMLELEIEKVYRDGENQAKIFETAGGFAPTLGIIGTVLGLMNLLGNLQDPASLAKSISIAFTATLYGVASANLIYFPIANKIKARTVEKIEDLELIAAGLLSIQAGDHPILLRRKLQAYVRISDTMIDSVLDDTETGENR